MFFCSHDEYQKAANWLTSQTRHRPQVAIICGSGLGMLADTLKSQNSFAYSDIPGFPQSTGKQKTACVILFFTQENHFRCELIFFEKKKIRLKSKCQVHFCSSAGTCRSASFWGTKWEDMRVHAGSLPHV